MVVSVPLARLPPLKAGPSFVGLCGSDLPHRTLITKKGRKCDLPDVIHPGKKRAKSEIMVGMATKRASK